MPRNPELTSVLVLGAGPIQIGQACEFDYSGTQALKALREEGVRTILLNSNPASIMTDPQRADATYLEPLNLAVLEKILERERPAALLPTVGGQTALNLAMEAHKAGLLERYGVRLIGAQPAAIDRGEDREQFKALMDELGLETCRGGFAHSMEEARAIAKITGFPAILRPSFTLGGSGGGIAYNVEDFEAIAQRGLDLSPIHQVLVEESILGWKEFELEVVRDLDDNVEIICGIENLDPMGIHTGDSITVAPILTLTDPEYQRMREAAKAVIRGVGVETGGSNIQFALDPVSGRMIVIEMNPRVSRSSALASKATGFPIAWVATKLALGYRLWELPNVITARTKAAFEPVLDYVVVKVPRFTFEKFPETEPVLGIQMKSVGETMAIGRSFQEALQKALRSLEEGHLGLAGALDGKLDLARLKEHLLTPGPQRIFWIYQALRAGHSIDELHRLTCISPWFLREMEEIVVLEGRLRGFPLERLPRELLEKGKRAGFTDSQIAAFCGTTEAAVAALREAMDLRHAVKRIDTCSGEFLAETPYLYQTWEERSEAPPTDRPKAIVLGSGPNRIGQGVEFDCCCVQAVEAIRAKGVEAILVNCNPETVSTDFDISDRLYFEPLVFEDVKAVVDREAAGGHLLGVFTQFGGQTPLKLAQRLEAAGVPLLGTAHKAIFDAEDRKRFGEVLGRLEIPAAPWGMAATPAQALAVAEKLGYPVMVRPSFVLGGRAMAIVFDDAGLEKYMREATLVSEDRPVLIDRYLENAQELDVDLVCDGGSAVIAGVMAHIEEAGVHSGDSYAVFPPLGVPEGILETVKAMSRALAFELGVRGLLNLQWALKDGVPYCLEANPRASRTVPFISKATGVNWAGVAARIGLGETLLEQGVRDGQALAVAVKGVVFPFAKFPGVDPVLGPEMRSTGEVMGVGETFGEAYAKALQAAHMVLPLSGTVFLSVNDQDKPHLPELVKRLASLGFGLCATDGTARSLEAAGYRVRRIHKVNEGRPNAVDLLKNGEIQWVVNTPHGKNAFVDEDSIRRQSLRLKIPCVTNMSAALAACEAVETLRGEVRVRNLQELGGRI
ncbi:carbamoyl-phosphate synthase large subunit [Mesoterricola silvestris]|uniref:Carbamoyl phosphate synthase large chain n=1 Tax=Mesoterricola silvestris TaxID=2927979 RepID=A0AA48GIZ7_9BACT|nr:carbamoyl-phosphate synthase large subunit [Mesoterricola silvestris]BDU73856.1 carbamoyl-phosphate synthase (glutamine-hydrolyzing) [Mesoterricola silvestris]